MKKIVMDSNEANLLKTMKENILERNEDLIALYNLLHSINDPFSIAIDAPWGEGKTFFLKQLQLLYKSCVKTLGDEHQLELRNTVISYFKGVSFDESAKCIYFDAWKNDYSKYPLQALIFSICLQLDEDYKTNMLDDDNLLSIIRKMFLCLDNRGKDIVNTLSNPSDIKEYLKEYNMSDLISHFFKHINEEHADKLIILIDELDRCNPHFAVRLLEGIKHYCCNENIIFVFGINSSQLQHTIKKYYGNGFDALRYLDRFFDLHISLTPHDILTYNKSIMTDYTSINDFCNCICRSYGLSLRETCHLYEVSQSASEKWFDQKNDMNLKSSEGKGKTIMTILLIPLLYALKSTDSFSYEKFIGGTYCDPLFQYLSFLQEGFLFEEYFLSEEDSAVEINDEFIRGRIKEFYEAVFANEYITTHFVKVGEMKFDKNSKSFILNEISRY